MNWNETIRELADRELAEQLRLKETERCVVNKQAALLGDVLDGLNQALNGLETAIDSGELSEEHRATCLVSSWDIKRMRIRLLRAKRPVDLSEEGKT